MKEIETDFLVPQFKGQLAFLNGLFQEMIDICDREMTNKTLGTVITSLYKREGATPANEMVKQTEEEAASTYFSKVKNIVQKEYLNKGQELLDQAENIDKLKDFVTWINKFNLFATSTKSAGEKPFTLRLNTFHTLHNRMTGEFSGGMPEEFDLIIVPFKTLLSQIDSVVSSAIFSINSYTKSRLEWKRENLEIKNKKFGMYLQAITIFLTMSISLVFISVNDPYKMYILKKQNIRRQKKIEAITAELNDVQNQKLQLIINNPKVIPFR